MEECTIVSFYENKNTHAYAVERTQDGEMRRCGDPIRMVSRDSAICPLSENCNQIAIQEDHSKMVKFKSRTDPHYQRVYSQVKEMMEKHEAKLSDTSYTPIQTVAPKPYQMCLVQERL
ncbi:Similar to hypothetical protein AOL_s00004g380 [Arthrobotrys oligospora ATCC 24927]; acc. no. EGX54347 [Pyronema omphalodes CBS 100304]|uniref:Uncharacterized protein n=1 Tax=Pyronema omphalodes (strain CBS 100304) TaxID=1076935 RepID=U4L6W8_PYROM|nr:Similar to hypothetical protein AOL_s00004g380 [Arthrobotrys oligospora ATCC 24927]; acc. no. EGX54347 [Pyronema omphalodes CBS 100304]